MLTISDNPDEINSQNEAVVSKAIVTKKVGKGSQNLQRYLKKKPILFHGNHLMMK